MDDKGKLTGGTALLIVAGLVLVLIGGALAPDGQVYTWLLVGAWAATNAALNNIYRKVRTKVREREIREEEQRRLAGFPQAPQDRRYPR